jgi:hypothetical protein
LEAVKNSIEVLKLINNKLKYDKDILREAYRNCILYKRGTFEYFATPCTCDGNGKACKRHDRDRFKLAPYLGRAYIEQNRVLFIQFELDYQSSTIARLNHVYGSPLCDMVCITGN